MCCSPRHKLDQELDPRISFLSALWLVSPPQTLPHLPPATQVMEDCMHHSGDTSSAGSHETHMNLEVRRQHQLVSNLTGFLTKLEQHLERSHPFRTAFLC